jgi:hypothetical protein
MAYEALQSLNRLLQYRQEREEGRVSQALAFMELSERRKSREMQVRQQNIAVMGANLELMQKANETMKMRSADKFLQESGLSGLYSKYKEIDDGLTKAVNELSSKPSKMWGEDEYSVEMNREIASDLISATWAVYETGRPDAIINIGAKLHFLDDIGVTVTAGSYEEKLSQSLNKLGYLKTGQDNSYVINTFKTMRNALDNEISIRKELEGFVKGDYKVDEDFTFVDESLNRLDMESIKPEIPTAETKSTDILSMGKKIEQIGTLKEEHRQKIEVNKNAIKTLNQLEKDVAFYSVSDPNYEISKEDLLQIKNKNITNIELTKEINASLTAIENLEKTEEKFVSEESIRDIKRKVEEGEAMDLFFTDIIGYGGGLKGASLSEKWELFKSAKKVQEEKLVSDIKSIPSSLLEKLL